MYATLKNILSKLIPKKSLIKHEVKLRSLFYFFYRGSAYECVICEKKLKKFIQNKNNHSICPNCGSIHRVRRLWMILKNEFLMDGKVVLDFSPSRSLFRKLNSIRNIQYISTDISGDFLAENKFDITQLEIKDEQIDLILCYHILEHIPDDLKAISELYRVLKPGGKIIIQTPFKDGEIYEDFTITNPQERLKHFGQEDHVRVYSIKGLENRINQIGFDTEVRTYPNEHKPYGFIDETIIIASKKQ